MTSDFSSNAQAVNNMKWQVGSIGGRELQCSFYSIHTPDQIRRAFFWIEFFFF